MTQIRKQISRRRGSGLTSLSVWLVSVSPAFKRRLWKLCYEALAARYRTPQWAFMNFGYAETDPAIPEISLSEADQPNRYCIQLYDHVLRPARARLPGARVLEVGCGRGGGCDYVFRSGTPQSVTGVDFSSRAASLCQRAFAKPHLSFQQGDAEALPFPDASFDIVLNVESSHCYGSMERFMSEAARVLTPGGYFLWADMRPAEARETVGHELMGSGLVRVSEQTITPNVLLSLDRMTGDRTRMIQSMVPWPFRKGLQDFAGLSGSRLHEALRTGTLGVSQLCASEAWGLAATWAWASALTFLAARERRRAGFDSRPSDVTSVPRQKSARGKRTLKLRCMYRWCSRWCSRRNKNQRKRSSRCPRGTCIR